MATGKVIEPEVEDVLLVEESINEGLFSVVEERGELFVVFPHFLAHAAVAVQLAYSHGLEMFPDVKDVNLVVVMVESNEVLFCSKEISNGFLKLDGPLVFEDPSMVENLERKFLAILVVCCFVEQLAVRVHEGGCDDFGGWHFVIEDFGS